MTGIKTCTCPSGDGSLRWPCPQHPPTAQLSDRERVAMALYAENRIHGRASWEFLTKEVRKTYFRFADAAIAAMEAK